jgi:transcription initiation factor IIE alpha subunit
MTTDREALERKLIDILEHFDITSDYTIQTSSTHLVGHIRKALVKQVINLLESETTAAYAKGREYEREQIVEVIKGKPTDSIIHWKDGTIVEDSISRQVLLEALEKYDHALKDADETMERTRKKYPKLLGSDTKE